MVDAGYRPVYRLYHWLWAGIDLLYPPSCGGCGRPGQRWCPVCEGATKPLVEDLCPTCGAPGSGGITCRRCSNDPPELYRIRSWTIYNGPVRNAIQGLKYRRDLGLGEALSRPLASYFQGWGWTLDGILPVPLSEKRRQERGYNQVTLVAWPFALALQRPLLSKALHRVRDTESQVGLSLQQRKTNVRNAFSADPKRVSGRSLLLVDDVFTTGSTLRAAAAALREAGAARVYGLTLARAVLRNDSPRGN